jgi:hypothetical protein
MKVDRKDGRCRSCGGTLIIVDADDATMTVECTDPACGERYAVEPDAFGDGAMLYYVTVLSKKLEGGESE